MGIEYDHPMTRLQRYNQILMAIMGTAALLGGVFILIPLVVGSISSRTEPGLIVGKKGEDVPEQRVVFCTPEFLERFQYLPVAVMSAEDDSRVPVLGSADYVRVSRYSRSCDLDSYSSSKRIFNVIIRDTDSGQQRLLLAFPGQVVSFRIPAPDCSEDKGPMPCGTIIWSIRLS